MIVVPTCVYRFYDAEDRLLYVGVTDAPGTRFADHRRKSWWKLAVRNTIVWHDRRRDALVEEASAIANERPIHNTAGPVPVPTTQEEFDALPQRRRIQKAEPRRPKGTGSVFERKRPGKPDLWVGRAHLGWSDDGRRLIKEFASQSREVVEARLAEFIASQQGAA